MWSLNRGGLSIEVVSWAGLTVFPSYNTEDTTYNTLDVGDKMIGKIKLIKVSILQKK